MILMTLGRDKCMQLESLVPDPSLDEVEITTEKLESYKSPG
jgi:hypothetical protein